MLEQRSLDMLVKERLKHWPQRPPGLRMPRRGRHVWLRGRPGDDADCCHPFLKLPGSTRLRTVPDGLWLNFGGTIAEPFVDIFVIEACGTLQNLLDKRSRFAPNTHSLLAVCPVPWLLAPAMKGDPTPRWQAIGVLAHAPALPTMFPVRNPVVLYGLKQKHYDGFARHQLPQGHELFAPMEALTAEDGDKDPEMHALLQRGSPIAKFLRLP
ncbi:MAG TPA: hypothetical protein VMU81_27800 [Acetobacteraceae bacterium]|nr:hypothetical protein [Acetobacteraceae bacterium]